jgi:hypothetical protein
VRTGWREVVKIKAILGILGCCAAGAALSGCTTQGEFVGVYGTVTLPDGTPAQVYAAQADPTQADASQNPLDGGVANVLVYKGDDCLPLYYGGKNTFLKIAQDFSSATLTIKRSRFGRMDFSFTGGGQTLPMTVPVPKACPSSDPNGTQQAVVAAGQSATDAWKIGDKSGSSPGMIGALAYQASYNNKPWDLLVPDGAGPDQFSMLLTQHANSGRAAQRQLQPAPSVAPSSHPRAAWGLPRGLRPL